MSSDYHSSVAEISIDYLVSHIILPIPFIHDSVEIEKDPEENYRASEHYEDQLEHLVFNAPSGHVALRSFLKRNKKLFEDVYPHMEQLTDHQVEYIFGELINYFLSMGPTRKESMRPN
ncbi:MAG: hypothetical protein ABIG93_04525 [archaeon]|nr:hypothetical protein [Nanoarchaeota archaeon]